MAQVVLNLFIHSSFLENELQICIHILMDPCGPLCRRSHGSDSEATRSVILKGGGFRLESHVFAKEVLPQYGRQSPPPIP